MDEGVRAAQGLEPVPEGTGQGSVPHKLNRPSAMQHMACIEDLRRVARRKVPRAFFGYAEAGSYSEETLRANRADMERIKLRQRVLVDSRNETRARNPRRESPSPVRLGSDRHRRTSIRQWRDSRLPCRASRRYSYTLSTMSIRSIEDVARRPTSRSGSSSTHEGSRFRALADRARRRCQMQRVDAHCRSTGTRATPC